MLYPLSYLPHLCYSVCKSHKAPMHTLSCLPVYTVCREPPLPPVLPSVYTQPSPPVGAGAGSVGCWAAPDEQQHAPEYISIVITIILLSSFLPPSSLYFNCHISIYELISGRIATTQVRFISLAISVTIDTITIIFVLDIYAQESFSPSSQSPL